MNFKKFHESKNLLNPSVLTDGYHLDTTTGLPTQRGSNDRVATLTPIDVTSISAVTLSYLCTINDANFMYSIFDANDTLLARVTAKHSGDSIDVSNAAKLYIAFYGNSAVTISSLSQVMLNTGSQPLPYEPYSSEVWHDIPYYKHKTATDTLTLPAVIYPNDTSITVDIKGNTTQSGTPSPQNPVDVNGTGERTANLFDAATAYGDMYDSVTGVLVGAASTLTAMRNKFASSMVGVPITISIRADDVPVTRVYIRCNIGGTNIDSNSIANGKTGTMTVTVTPTSVNDDWRVTFGTGSGDLTLSKIMLNSGSTALPYESYGYKIPISSAGQTTPVYLGEVETTRRVKKLVLTGEEIILRDREREGSWRFFTDKLISAKDSTGICSHFENIGTNGVNNSDNIGFSIFNNAQFGCRCPKSLADTVTDFKAYLAAQYLAGTPVCVWYVLATETTGIVNEPLMKIGGYADTLSNVSIPVTAGGDTISVGTTLQPSEATVNYKGWHPASVKEYYFDKTISDLEDMTISQMQTYTIISLQGGNWS